MYHNKLTEPIPRDQEREFAVRYRRGDKRAGDRLIEANMRFVVKIALQFQNKYGGNLEDYIQEGALGLMRALSKFEPERGWKLISYAVHWIRVHIHNEVLRNVSLVKYGTTQTQRKLFFELPRALNQMVNNGSDGPTNDELARELKIDVREIEAARVRLSGHDLSLNAPWGKHETDGFTWLDNVFDPAPGCDFLFEEAESAALEASLLHQGLRLLTPRERQVIEMRYMRDPGATLKEVGASLGFSREYARRLEVQGLKKIDTYVKEAT